MTAEEVRHHLLRQWTLLVTCTLFAGLGALGASAFITPLYQSTTVVHAVVSPATPNTYALLVLDTLIGTEAQLAVSKPILTQVASHYPGLSADMLRKELTVTPQQNTQLFQITVLDPSPKRAALLANDIATALIAYEHQALQERNAQAEQVLQSQLADTQNAIDNLTAELHAADTPSAKAAILQTQLDEKKQQYSQLATDLSNLQLDDAEYTVTMRVAVPAQPADTPVRPVPLVNSAVGLLCGLLLGILLALLRAQLDQRLGSAGEIGELLGLPVLATTAAPRARSRRGPTPPSQQPDEPPPDLYTTLQRSLDFLSIEQPIRSIVMVGVVPTDRAGLVVANWALSQAVRRKKTLLVDANLLHAQQAAYFGVAEESGLTDAVLTINQSNDGAVPLTQYLQSPATVDAPWLSVLTAGTKPPNPTQVIGSHAMGALFGALLGLGADIVLFNGPAVLDRVAASALEEHVDGVVLVIERTRVGKRHVLKAKAKLQRGRARVLGCVVVDRDYVSAPQARPRLPDAPPSQMQYAPAPASPLPEMRERR